MRRFSQLWTRSRSTRPISRSTRLSSEHLEPRTLLAADLMITEFLASNDGTLNDNDRQSSDWIEIYNRGDEAADLSGWYLTDDANNLAKWSFPEASLPPQEYLVVFASGKDRQDRDGELHTNFRLSSSGEYLALVQTDGQTIVSEFAPEFPQQFTDVSYGFRMADVEKTFVGVGSTAQLLVPTDNSLGTEWTKTDFVPGPEWLTEISPGSPVMVGIGYESNSGFAADIQTDVQSVMKGSNASVFLRMPFQVESLDDITELLLRIKYDDGYALYLNGGLLDIQNAPLFSSYDSTATSARSNDDAVQSDEIDMSQYLDRLLVGENVLAIQGYNIAADDDDFLLVPELFTTGLSVQEDTEGYFSTPTPGTTNLSEFALGPAIRDVAHSPQQPAVGDALIVTAAVNEALHPLQQVNLVYRVMFTDEVTVSMADDGAGVDQTAGDGIYSGTIPADVAAPGQLLRYYVTASDDTNELSRAPQITDTAGTDRSPEYFGTVVFDPTLESDLPLFQWFTESEGSARNRRGARTSVYYQGELYDNVFVRQRGGAINLRSQKFNFNDDQKLFVNDQLGRVAEFNMNAEGSDSSFLRQSLAFEAFAWADNATSVSFLTQMRVNGQQDRVGVFIEQVDQDYLRRNGLDPEGALYKFVQRSNLDPVFADTTTGIEKKTRLDEGKEDIQAVVDGLTQSTAPQRAASVFDNFDVAQVLNYLAVRSVSLDADDVRKNFYLFRDTNGTSQWSIFPWDKDWTYGVTGDGGPDLTHPFFGDQAHRKPNANQWNRLYDAIFTDPVLSEMYLRRLRTVMDDLLQPPETPTSQGRFEQRVDEMSAAAGNLLSRSAIRQAQNVKNYFPNRRTELFLDQSIDNTTQGEIRDIIPEFVNGVQYFVPTDNSLGTTWTGIAEPANVAEWQTGQAGFGFNDRFSELIRTTVKPTDSCGECTSILLRVPFQVTDASSIESLTLRMKYDDGFVAYINGTEVARARFDGGDPTYDARAKSHSNTLAKEFDNFNISPFTNLLQDGDNILAIHALNSSATSNDQLIMPVLVDGVIGDDDVAGIPHEQQGNPAIEFGQFDYNPSSGNQDEEFIELRNPLDTAVDISGWRLTGGIEHAFLPGTVIPSNGSLFVSPNVPAFLARSSGPRGGESRFVQGNYAGHLSNFGETVELIAADDSSIATMSTPVAPTDAQLYLRVSELNYNPAGPDDATEFIELTNISSGATATTLDLAGVTFSGGPAETFTFAAGTTLGAGQFLVIAKDPVAMAAAYPQLTASQTFGPFTGSLSNGGESLRLDDTQGSTILEFSYADNALWPQRADGAGASLEVVDPVGTPVELLEKPYSWRGSVDVSGSPGQPGQTPIGVVVNEVLANTDGPGALDAVELLNTTSQTIDLSGWYLSDSSGDFRKYAFPAGAKLGAGEYLVISESEFNAPQAAGAFALNGDRGDDVWLMATDPVSGQFSRFVDDVHFGAMASGESWGRDRNGQGILAPQKTTSLGTVNGDPRVGPLVISEINYHPSDPSDEARVVDPSLRASDLEYLEIHNPTAASIDLSTWRLRGGVDFDFRPNTMLGPGATLLVVPFNPAGKGNGTRTEAFRTHYAIGDDVTIVGGYQGRLNDRYDRVELQRPGTPPADELNFVPRLSEDEVRYDDLAPWPTQADGGGATLTRVATTAYGNVASSWLASSPTPGSVNSVDGDLNNDGVIDASDIDTLCQAIQGNDVQFDLNGDGVVDKDDLAFFVQGILQTSIGDANLDGIFNSNDFVLVLAAGEYEDAIDGNSTWAEGDWNCDGDFTTDDLVAALQAGGYVSAASAPAIATSATSGVNPVAASVLWQVGQDRDRPANANSTARDATGTIRRPIQVRRGESIGRPTDLQSLSRELIFAESFDEFGVAHSHSNRAAKTLGDDSNLGDSNDWPFGV